MSSSDHSQCHLQMSQSNSYPSRLIDVKPDNNNEDFWRLIELGPDGVPGPYMTLSHRWSSGTVRLEQKTQAAMLRGMPVSTLPVTYQDALRVARYLQVRYLWIDSICIHSPDILTPR